MPYTFNGIGTWYYGKRNKFTHVAICEFCGNTAELSSYDTTKFFVFVYIPIFPLGGKRIIDQCSCCRKHRVLSLTEWKCHLEETIDNLHAKWLKDPSNLEAAVELLHSIAYFKDMDKLNSIAPDIRMHCSYNAEIMNELGLVYAFLNQFEEAEKAFNASLAAKQDRNTEENLAESLMKGLKPDKAKPYINHIIQEKINDKLYYIFLLIESYQYIGDHRAAMQIIEECEKAFPEIKNEKPLRTYRKKSQRNYDNSKSVKGSLIPIKSKDKESEELSFILPKIIFPSLIVLALMLYTLSAFLIGLSREVYLISGLDKPYSIELNGDKIELEPMSRKAIKLSEGTTNIEILDLNSEEKNLTVNFHTPFWTRPFNKPVLVINPDKVAVFLWQETEYTVEDYDNSDYEAPYRYYAGQHFYKLDSVDYLFKEFPESFMSQDGAKEVKTQFIQLDNDELNSYYISILNSLDAEQALSYTRAKLYYEPDNEVNIYAHLNYLDMDSAIELLKSKLDERPVLINWHRTYQTYMEAYEPSYDLKGEYLAYLENEKDNKALYYLLSRITEDPKEAEKLLLKSIEGNDPSPFGYYGIAYQMLSDGSFEQALSYVQKAVEALPQQESFQLILNEALLAQGKYDLLLEQIRAKQRKSPYDRELIAEEVRLYMAKNDSSNAENVIYTYLTHFESDEELKEIWNTYLNGIIAYCNKDAEKYAASIADLDDPEFSFESSFINKEYDKAFQTALENGFDGTYYLLLYLAEDNHETATKYLNYAIDTFRSGDKTSQLLADYLSGTKDFSLDEVKSVLILPKTKRTVMAALGKLDPDYQKELYAFAKKLNYERVFPYHIISEIVENS